MPDVFEVLKADHEEVKAMLAQLEDGPKADGGATDEQLASRRRAVDQAVIEESRHEAAVQQYFWPALSELGPDGIRVSEEGQQQEAYAEPVLAELTLLEPADEGFEEQLSAFISAARAHIAFEEAHAWPLLRASISEQEAQALGDRISRARKLSPAQRERA
jgi:Hemerythrin HHE cation binding domain